MSNVLTADQMTQFRIMELMNYFWIVVSWISQLVYFRKLVNIQRNAFTFINFDLCVIFDNYKKSTIHCSSNILLLLVKLRPICWSTSLHSYAFHNPSFMLRDVSACADERLTRDSWGSEFLSFVPSITMGRCRTVLVVSQKPESKDGVWMFGLCLLFCIILPKMLVFIFSCIWGIIL